MLFEQMKSSRVLNLELDQLLSAKTQAFVVTG